MVHSTLSSAAVKVRQWAASNPAVRRVWLFGSRVRGTHSVESDLDIAVEVSALPGDEDAFTTWVAESGSWQRQLSTLLPWRAHLSRYEGTATSEVSEGIRDGVLVYEREVTA